MIRRFRSGDLTSLRQARSRLVAIVAIQFLRRAVFGVAEVHSKRRGPLRSSAVTAELMARAARRNVSVTRLRPRRVAGIARRMRIEPDRNRHCYTASCRLVASSTIDAVHTQVTRVIKVDAKTLQRRKRFKRAGVYVRMTNCADRTLFIRELLSVTAGARSMAHSSGQVGPCRIRFAPVT